MFMKPLLAAVYNDYPILMHKIVALECAFLSIFIVVKQERPRLAESGRTISRALCGTINGVANFPPNINSERTSL